MTPDSTGFPTPEPQRDPTPQDLQDLTIRASNLGRGDLVHKMGNHLGVLAALIEFAKKEGWNKSLRKKWDVKVAEINTDIALVKLDQAREKGLL